MLIQRLLPLAFLFFTVPSFAQAQTGSGGIVEEPRPESSQNNNINGNLNNGDLQSEPAPEALNQEAPMAPVSPESTTEPAMEGQPPAVAPGGDSATETEAPAAVPGETAPETQGPTELQIPEAPAARTLDGKAMPVRGMTMKEVEKQFGQPQEKRSAVGKPPIIRWIYGDYTVYFERKYVIHSVPNQAAPSVPSDQTIPEQTVPQQTVPKQTVPEQPPKE